MATHSSTLAWQIPWTEEPGGLPSLGSHRVGHDWVTSLSLSCTGEGNGNLLHCSCLENPRDGGVWWATVSGVAQSRTWLKRLSSSSSSYLLWISLLLFYLREISLSLSHFFFLWQHSAKKAADMVEHAWLPTNVSVLLDSQEATARKVRKLFL